MNRIEWMLPTSNTEAYHRAGGRRAYNARRMFEAGQRRLKLIELIRAGQSNAEIARMFGVHRSTIGRDIKSFWVLELMDMRKLTGCLPG